jgi:hypothetical protein
MLSGTYPRTFSVPDSDTCDVHRDGYLGPSRMPPQLEPLEPLFSSCFLWIASPITWNSTAEDLGT